MRATRITTIALLLLPSLLAYPGAAHAQETRESLIEEAQSSLDATRMLELLVQASNPALGPLDSLWATSVHAVAQGLFNEGETDLAQTWLRWSARMAPEWPIDTLAYFPEVVTAYREAQASVQSESETADGAATISWEWSPDGGADGEGTLRFATAEPAVQLAVDGRTFQTGESVDLPPGTYEVLATAEDHDDVRVRHEVLPGVTTVLEFAPAPQLPAATRDRVAAALVRVTQPGTAGPVCQPGFIAAADGLVLTTFGSLQPDRQIGLDGGPNVPTGSSVRIAASDAQLDLAVLATGAPATAFLGGGDTPALASYAWTLHLDACQGDVLTRRAEVTDGGGPQRVAAFDAAATTVTGAALIDRDGQLLGFVNGAGTAASIGQIAALLDRARAPFVAELPEEMVEQQEAGGGAPWGLIAGGAGAAGALVALLGGGGGGDPHPDPDPDPRGNIRIIWGATP